ncbi:hypothetical protein HCG49_09780 [Arenibacter sp. 6A1]|uniref:hypothetical protein n=1 Tax=Arenibacter sp. 6A1 TaxID=2720391 RepID=UPI001445C87E|nr:hypothetical protein [Arenibacter sp. 6A1]NKI26852.1 hypothetical protein [Arenibacter sp. 6A1]
MKIKIGYLILFIQLGIVFISDFVSRLVTYFSHSTQLLFSVVFIFLIIYFYKRRIDLNSAKFVFLIISILSIGLIRNQFLLNLFQLILIASNFIFIFFAHKLDEKSLKKLLGLILIFSFSQLFFDLLFPREVIDLKDQYSGTFIMANNKSRFLMFILPFAFLLPKNQYYLNFIGKFFFLVSVVISIYIGYSNLAILIFIISLGLALISKNIYTVFIFYIIGIFALGSISKMYLNKENSKNYSTLDMNYHRFFHSEHGVAAVYKYGFVKLKESYFLGVGLGNFTSRSGQIFNSEITANIPKQRIKFWAPLFDTKAPYGLSSLYVLFIELGIFSLIPISILFKWFNKLLKTANFNIRVMTIFLFLIINYNPTFFEFNESLLYFLTLVVVSNLSIINERNNLYQST